MKSDDFSTFRTWLSKNTEFSYKVINDTVSRLRRLDSIKPLRTDLSGEDYLVDLKNFENFHGLSMSVKSQMRRAYRLYRKFKVSD